MSVSGCCSEEVFPIELTGRQVIRMELDSSTALGLSMKRRRRGRIMGKQALKMPMLTSTTDHVPTPYSVPRDALVCSPRWLGLTYR